MSDMTSERRRIGRNPRQVAFAVMVEDESFPAELTDISTAGIQARLDAVLFDEIRERIDGVRFGTRPPLPITLHWGFFDGRFGASFKDTLLAQSVLDEFFPALSDANPAAEG
ncbi:MAG: hypothetical protein KDK53_13280 [Maritimibacter sp.]|nr:hypothetical protein [Maritimibacter sp.]